MVIHPEDGGGKGQCLAKPYKHRVMYLPDRGHHKPRHQQPDPREHHRHGGVFS